MSSLCLAYNTCYHSCLYVLSLFRIQQVTLILSESVVTRDQALYFYSTKQEQKMCTILHYPVVVLVYVDLPGFCD